MVDEVRHYMASFGDDVSENELKLYLAIKKVRKLVAAGDKAAAQEAFKAAESTIDKMARKGVLHGNAAARHKSRLAAEIKALA